MNLEARDLSDRLSDQGCVGLELATIERGSLDEWVQNMPVWTEAKNLEYVFDTKPRGYVPGPGCRPVEDGCIRWMDAAESVGT